jgi:hypothetical protein
MNTKKKISLLFLLFLLSISITADEVTFEGDFETNFPNPERGYCYSIDPGFENMTWSFCEQDPAKYTPIGWTSAMNKSQLKYLRSTKGFTLVLVRYHIAEFRYKPFSPEFLNRLQTDLNTIRDEKFKIIPMFAYNWVGGGPDASASTIIGHLEQLRPIFQNNYDVIAFMHLGFIGCWGEMHSSAFGNLDTSKGYHRLNQNTYDIINKAFDVLPKERMIAVRSPLYKFQYFNGLDDDAVKENTPIENILLSEAFNQTIRSRWANHEDCLVCGEWNCGTYNTPANDPIAVINFLENENKYVVQSGESGIVNGCGSPLEDMDGDGYKGDDMRDDCSRVTEQLAKLRWSTINENFNWNDNPSTPKWKSDGCYDEIARKLGYRFRITTGVIPTQISINESFSITLNIVNDGYASCYNKRGVEFIFRNKINGEIFKIPVLEDKSNDPRFWHSGGSYVLSLNNATLPAYLPTGTYELLLNLYDPHPNLSAIPEYSIRLANKNIWEKSTGYNLLHQEITINNPTNLVELKNDPESYIIIQNTSHNTFTIQKANQKIISVDLLDISGKKICTFENASGDISNLQSGIYIALINTIEDRVIRKFNKQ